MLGIYGCPRVSKPTKAVWFLKSSDKKWCASGPFIYRGMRGIPIECSTKIEELKLEYGEPPEDLDWGFKLSALKYFFKKIIGFLGF